MNWWVLPIGEHKFAKVAIFISRDQFSVFEWMEISKIGMLEASFIGERKYHLSQYPEYFHHRVNIHGNLHSKLDYDLL